MQHADIRRALAERLADLLESQDRLPIQPRPYQCATLARTKQWLEDLGGTPRGYVSQATGLGKTWLFSAMVSHCTGLRTLIVVPTKVLIEQTARFIVRFTGGMIGHLSSLKQIRTIDGEVIAVRGHEHSDVVITTDESFIRHAAKIATEFDPQFIVWDECHWGYTAQAQRALAEFPKAVIIGFSATPDYLGAAARGGFVPVTLDNGQVLYGDLNRLARTHFGTLIDERIVRWGVENHWLAPFAWGMVECDIPLDQVPTAMTAVGLDYREDALQALMAKHWPMIVEVVRRLYEDPQYTLAQRQVFAVCPSVKTAEALADAIYELGIPSACITAATSDTDRNELLASYAIGEINLLTSVMVLREGWDAPNAEVCLMLRPTKSRVLYLQSMGRVLRPAPKIIRKVALVVDAFFQNARFSPLSAPVLFGTPGQMVKERGILLGPKRSHDKAVSTPDAEPQPVLEEEPSPYLLPGVQPRLVFVHPLKVEYWAGSDGTFEADGEIWASPPALEEEFRACWQAILRRLVKGKVRSQCAMNRANRTSTFYCLTEAREACKDLCLTRPGPRGIVFVDHKLWASRNFLREYFGLADGTVKAYLKDARVRKLKGRSASGRVTTLYCVTDARRAVRRLLILKVGQNGLVRADGQVWTTRIAAILHFGFSKGQYKTVTRRMRVRRMRMRRGKNRQGCRVTLYCLADLRRVFTTLKILRDKPQANARGFITLRGATYSPIDVLADLLGLNEKIVSRCVKESSCRTIEGRNRIGRLFTFYCTRDARILCADAIRKRVNQRRKRRQIRE